MTKFGYEIVQCLGVLSERISGWRREVNIISWNNTEPKYDIRDWSPGHETMGKGISLSKEEIDELKKILSSHS